MSCCIAVLDERVLVSLTRRQDKIRHAEKRIFLATLYIGKSEAELVCYLQFNLTSIVANM